MVPSPEQQDAKISADAKRVRVRVDDVAVDTRTPRGHELALLSFTVYLSNHPDLHIITDRGLLRNNPELALKLIDDFINTGGA
jgi:hypothetical protein